MNRLVFAERLEVLMDRLDLLAAECWCADEANKTRLYKRLVRALRDKAALLDFEAVVGPAADNEYEELITIVEETIAWECGVTPLYQIRELIANG